MVSAGFPLSIRVCGERLWPCGSAQGSVRCRGSAVAVCVTQRFRAVQEHHGL